MKKGCRIKEANGVFVQLHRVWRNLSISKEVKLRIFSTSVKSVLLYVCETLENYQPDNKKTTDICK